MEFSSIVGSLDDPNGVLYGSSSGPLSQVNLSRPCTKKEDTVSLPVGTDLTIGLQRKNQETAAPEMSPPEEVPITTVPGGNQVAETVAVEPPVVRERRKKGHKGIDANAPPKSLRRDHADLRPSGLLKVLLSPGTQSLKMILPLLKLGLREA
nr:hypothetical protein [Tanacetum cinerariifolium]